MIMLIIWKVFLLFRMSRGTLIIEFYSFLVQCILMHFNTKRDSGSSKSKNYKKKITTWVWLFFWVWLFKLDITLEIWNLPEKCVISIGNVIDIIVTSISSHQFICEVLSHNMGNIWKRWLCSYLNLGNIEGNPHGWD